MDKREVRCTIRLPKGAKVFLLEDSEDRIVWFKKHIPDVVIAETALQAIDILKGTEFDFIFLDHDLGLLNYAGYAEHENGSGRDVARYLSGQGYIGKNVVIHSWNPVGAAQMKDLLEGAYAIPFGQFDLFWE